jgi:hypothetical protein
MSARCPAAGKTNQHNSCRLVSARVRKLAEVLVFGQKNAPFRAGERQNDVVLRARIDFYDGGDVVAGVAQGSDDGEVAALVGEEPHRLVLVVDGAFADEDNLFVRECVSCVAHRRVDVLAGQARVAIEEIRLRGAFAQLAEQQLDGDARSADHGLPKHHARVDLDAIREHAASEQETPAAGAEPC